MKKLVLLILAMMCSAFFVLPAGAKVAVGGAVVLDGYYHRFDSDGAINVLGQGTDDWQQLEIEVPTDTNLHADWINDDGNVRMYIELELGGPNGSTAVGLAHAYGWWQITPMFKLLVGHTDGSFATLEPDQAIGVASGHSAGEGFGNLSPGNNPQIRLEVKLNDVVSVHVSALDNRAFDTWESPGNEENVWPRFDIIVPINIGPFYFEPGFSWSKVKYDEGHVPGAKDEDKAFYVWAAALGVQFSYGPFTLTAEGTIGENLATANYGGPFAADGPGGVYFGPELDVSSDFEDWMLVDSEDLSFFIDLGFEAGPATIHAIYGYQETEVFYGWWSGSWPDKHGEINCRRQMYGVSVPVQVARIFIIRPELFVYDWGKTDIPDWDAAFWRDIPYGKEIIGGVQFLVEF
ncbi:hypothetical protein ACFL2O_06510 [Thermodesulfobacteriota bacterium]